MGYVVTIHPEYMMPDQCWVLQPSGGWTNRLKNDLLKYPEGTMGRLQVFGKKEEADQAKALIEGGDRRHGPDPAGTVKVEYVDAAPHHPKCRGGSFCLCETLWRFVEFVRKAHTGHDVEKGCTTGICKEIERLEKEGQV